MNKFTKEKSFYLKAGSSKNSVEISNLIGLKKESNFRVNKEAMKRMTKKQPVVRRKTMKGASMLDVREKKNYDVKQIHDPNAKPSKKAAKANMTGMSKVNPIEGDGDVWVEKIFRNRQTGSTRTFFVSKQTGKKVAFEPPTGASRVLYLRESYRMKNEGKTFPCESDIHEEKEIDDFTTETISESFSSRESKDSGSDD